MLPKVTILARAWKKICQETDFWANRSDTALESTFYPMVALQPKIGRTLCDSCRLEDLSQIVICEVFLPPRQFASYSQYSASFRHDASINSIFHEGVSKINKRYPQLLFLGPGHSHPFAIGYTYPSSTDLRCHILPYLNKNSALLDIHLSLAIILARNDEGWNPCCFAADENQVWDLGKAEISDSHKCHYLKQPYYKTVRGQDWEQSLRSELGDRLIELERWPGAWTSLAFYSKTCDAILLLLPPSFPIQPIVARVLHNAVISSNFVINLGTSFSKYKLTKIEETANERCLRKDLTHSRQPFV